MAQNNQYQISINKENQDSELPRHVIMQKLPDYGEILSPQYRVNQVFKLKAINLER